MAKPKQNLFVRVTSDGFYSVANMKEGVTLEYLNAKYAPSKYLKVKGSEPSLKTLEKYSDDGICKATDGCRVEPDGVCVHGHPSWLLALNFI